MTKALTPQDKAIKTARRTATTNAKRSLKLIIEAATQHAGLLEEGAVPEASFQVHVTAYEKARVSLALLETVASGDPGDVPDNGLVEVGRENLALFLTTLRAAIPGIDASPGSPLGELDAAVAGPPWEDNGEGQ